MILNISGRTDIVAFYSPWLMNRFEAGEILVRNPFYPSQVSKILIENVDAIVFCTKNPLPIIKYLPSIHKPMIFQVTLTPYHKDIEPFVPDKSKIIEGIKEISKLLGQEKVYVRYDPILLNEKYTVEYHIRAFERMCSLLKGYVNHIIVSFIDDYKNVRNHYDELKLKNPTHEDLKKIGIHFFDISNKNNMTVQTCYEKEDLSQYGFIKDVCVSRKLAFELTQKHYKLWSARDCGCIEMVDIGVYNTCHHYCKYCYANYDEKKIHENIMDHDEHSPFLIGHAKSDDIVKERFK